MFSKNLKFLAFMMLIIGVFLTGCQDGENKNKSTKEVSSAETQKEVQTSLKEQGYKINKITSYDENINVVTLEKEGQEYYGTIDDHFNWLMQPTNEYTYSSSDETTSGLEFHEGLAAVSVPETRKMRLENDSDARLWGFINAKGEWVVKPIYREVHNFSSGVAIVSTVEEDRDDLVNKRVIVIDNTGKELGEIFGSIEHYEYAGDISDTYTGDYAYSDGGFYDKKGNYTELPFVEEGELTPIGDKLINYIEHNNYPNVLEIRNLNGEVIKTFTYTDDVEVSGVSFEETLLENNLFHATLTTGTDALINTNGVTVIEGDTITMDLGEDLALVYEYTDGSSGISGTFYDLTGKEMFSVKKMRGHIYMNDRYFKEGKEYYTLVDVNGSVLIDESKKITTLGVMGTYNNFDDTLSSKLVPIEYRENAEDTKPNLALLNVETLEIIDYKELLK